MALDDSDEFGRREDEPATVHRLEFDVPWPPKHVAAYLIQGPEPILIDAGAPDAAAEAVLREGLERLGYEPSDIAHVLLTHLHSDHVGQVSTLRDAGATIHAPAPALERLRADPESLRERIDATAREAGYSETDRASVVDDLLESFRRERRLVDPARTQPIDPTSTLVVGGREITPIPTPGHEIDHLCFETALEGSRALFSGDVLVAPFRPVAFHVGLDREADEAVDAYYEAMARLEGTTATCVYPGHGPVFDNPKHVLDRTRARLDDLVEETHGALASIEPATALSVAKARVGELRYVAPVLDTLGALGTLEDRQRVQAESVDGVRFYRMS
ncbi:MBL fold metallo-hydrolase [Natrarchaeobaculum sulfurireducens]|uniref:Metal-dependent hydrolase of the beta-lactamase superfamily II n=1 Tax=Natrarchaeobaculum sulfurireducens TaxID=2044521 RepID=A0A346PGB5_9EURY|nr:MBL fold metallo-hydrolase [Natrarchaeobaculum sulfurireducens]AXR78560.1 Metal-dependent hydrolase of the beta-lactamase superfamily II [Natrarchaeobaculum sulfurireducens]